ncbi:aromatic amino acid ammonia-lyase [Sinomicrobium kalidii]|uniref:HAL/PAL/TAL family ammonia-lyase n=1 Tax=Sinomicrobium kalidii TaxID=2900738 RepID=UPI001E4D1813|nr:aromatic amino acid ammonia-lyase [Sinomicrobium kalidii]UGU15804.1 aromatic amino acid ammonia-lyase [Sinomicrobium kalidii]
MLILTKNLGIDEFSKVIFENKTISIAPETLDRVTESFNFLKSFSENKIIYGVNTGFGPMAQYKIEDNARIELQYNLIRSHASGCGTPIPPMYVKAAMLARMNTLALGYSGVHPSVITLMTTLINRDILPVIYEHGGVGASGDLVQLAHLALTLIGEGEVFYRGEKRPTEEVFEKEGLTPVKIALREGLALMNGTSVMTGIGIVNTVYAQRLLRWMVSCSAAINEIVGAYDDHLSYALNQTKKHRGQQQIAQVMRRHLEDSSMIRKREHHLYNNVAEEISVFEDKVQEYYSLRCVPQVLGPVLDTLTGVENILMEEVNSANDNPIVHLEDRQVYHGGNFHGDYVALEMDKLKTVVTKLSMLSERQLNYLLNPGLNKKLPPFVNLGKLGLNFGMQGVQFTATSTTAENQMLSNPMYVHSIPNNNDNQDIVSMGTNAALITKKVIENAFEVLAIETITIIQAIEYLDIQDKISSETKKMYCDIRQLVPIFTRDIAMYPYVRKVKDFIMNT